MMNRMREVFKCWSPEFAMLILGLMSLTMGLWLIHPVETFSTSPTYGVLGTAASEWFWGVLMLIPGVLKISGLLLRNWGVARAGFWAGFFIWMFFAFSFFQGNPTSPLASILFWKAILDGWIVLHIRGAEGGSDL